MITTEFRPCPGCQETAGPQLGTANGFEIRSCSSCGTLFTAKLPAVAEAKDYEAFYAEAHNLAVPDFVLGRLEDTVGRLERYRQTNRWIDIGCGTGTLLQAVKNRGWEPTGTEVAPAAVNAVRQAGFKVFLGETGDLDLPGGHFDVVSLIEVIEHVQDPDTLLTEAASLLRPGGALYLTTPHGRSLSARLLKTGWSVIAPPDHLQLFSVRGLRAALTRAGGLRVRSVATTGINPYELKTGLRSGRDRSGTPTNTETSYQLNESLSSSKAGTVFKRIVNRTLSATCLGDTLKVVADRPDT